MHEYFQKLYTLALSGQVSEDELKALRLHLNSCPICRERQAEFEQLIRWLPLASPKAPQKWLKPSFRRTAQMRDNFVRSARERGLRMSAESDRQPAELLAWGFRSVVFVPIVCALLVLVALIWVRRSESAFVPTRAVQMLPLSRADVSGQERAPTRLSVPKAAQQTADVTSQAESEIAYVRSEIVRLTIENSNLKSSITEARSEASLFQSNALGSENEVVRLTDENRALRQSLEESESRAKTIQASAESEKSELNAQLRNMIEARSEDQVEADSQQRRLIDLTAQLAEQRRISDREHELGAAYSDIRNLISDRNLHIVDVFDGSRQPKRRPFGRVFYSEGRALIFYAFDLGQATNEKKSFEAWAQRAHSSESAKSLGTFYLADSAAGLWILRASQPGRLQRIESVFVTDEAPGPGKHPTGKKLLYAYLGSSGSD